MTDAVPAISSILFALLEVVRSIVRYYVLSERHWHSISVLPWVQKVRARHNSTGQVLAVCGQFLGSETFYLIAIPCLCWSASEQFHVPMFVTFYCTNIYITTWLKNVLAFGRTPPAPPAPGVDSAEVEYGWPSLYAVNATALPFFVLRYWWGAFGTGTEFSAAYPTTTAVTYTIAFLYVALVCGARVYLGVSTSADVQGGMLVGGCLVRLWLLVCDVINDWIVSPSAYFFGIPQWAFALGLPVLLMIIHPISLEEEASWANFHSSVKATSFCATFTIGSNGAALHYACTMATFSFELTLVNVAFWCLRMTIGFVLLGAAYQGIEAIDRFAVKRYLAPKYPVAAQLLRNTGLMTTMGFMVSLFVPMVLFYLF